jgi:GNAT superfamily N-acetyltransferase
METPEQAVPGAALPSSHAALGREPLTICRYDQAGADDLPILSRFATDVYDRAFHERHREPADEWIRRLTHPGSEPRQHASIVLHGDQVIAGALSETYRSDIVLLTYIVVADTHRDQGVGSLLMREVRAKHHGCTLIAEMTDPDRAEPHEQAQARRRAAVFHAWGWRALGCAYHQPPLSPDENWTDDLLLLHHGPDTHVPASTVAALVTGLRESLGAGAPPDGLTHRYPPVPQHDLGRLRRTLRIPTGSLADLVGAGSPTRWPDRHTAE